METRRVSVLQGGGVRVSACIYSGMDADPGSASRGPELNPTGGADGSPSSTCAET